MVNLVTTYSLIINQKLFKYHKTLSGQIGPKWQKMYWENYLNLFKGNFDQITSKFGFGQNCDFEIKLITFDADTSLCQKFAQI